MIGIPSGWKLYAGLLLAGVVASIIFLAYRNYTGLISQVATLSADKATLTESLTAEKETAAALLRSVHGWQESYDKLGKRVVAMQQQNELATAEARRLEQLFNSTDIEALARVKPDDAERLVNAESDCLRGLLQQATEGGPQAAGHPEAAGPCTTAHAGAGAPAPVPVPAPHAEAPPVR